MALSDYWSEFGKIPIEFAPDSNNKMVSCQIITISQVFENLDTRVQIKNM